MSRRVFVAGGTGVLGRRVVPALVAAGCEVSAVVRSDAKRRQVAETGAQPVVVDLFDAAAVRDAVQGHDVVVNLATAIPSGLRAARPSAWKVNDGLRTVASKHLADAVHDDGRYIGESITFPYDDGGDAWIDESTPRSAHRFDRSVQDAEAAARSVTERGATGVTLRFAMFWAPDGAHHEMMVGPARRGWWLLPGPEDARVSWIHPDDAARAVVAALDAPVGVYNVAETEPLPRSAHAAALASAVGRDRLRRPPVALQRLGGDAIETMARSQRISSRALTEATGWRAEIAIVDRWASAV